jgi:hypothetical protein
MAHVLHILLDMSAQQRSAHSLEEEIPMNNDKKTPSKKLRLDQTEVRELSREDLKKVNGGTWFSFWNWFTDGGLTG